MSARLARLLLCLEPECRQRVVGVAVGALVAILAGVFAVWTGKGN